MSIAELDRLTEESDDDLLLILDFIQFVMSSGKALSICNLLNNLLNVHLQWWESIIQRELRGQ